MALVAHTARESIAMGLAKMSQVIMSLCKQQMLIGDLACYLIREYVASLKVEIMMEGGSKQKDNTANNT